jgi:diazepam-binding inhibitor (GABA receptor modulating acyl-CoA-binding protein)
MSKNEDTKVKAEFEKACEEIKSASNLDNETLLCLYGLYKQACEGNCNTPKPNFYDLKGIAKWSAWYENEGMDKVTAMRRYVRKVNKLLEK